jgi:hypothetical protein
MKEITCDQTESRRYGGNPNIYLSAFDSNGFQGEFLVCVDIMTVVVVNALSPTG